MTSKTLDEMVLRLAEILEAREESDSGREFSPTYISTCRAMVSHELSTLLPDLWAEAYRVQQERQMREWNI